MAANSWHNQICINTACYIKIRIFSLFWPKNAKKICNIVHKISTVPIWRNGRATFFWDVVTLKSQNSYSNHFYHRIYTYYDLLPLDIQWYHPNRAVLRYFITLTVNLFGNILSLRTQILKFWHSVSQSIFIAWDFYLPFKNCQELYFHKQAYISVYLQQKKLLEHQTWKKSENLYWQSNRTTFIFSSFG